MYSLLGLVLMAGAFYAGLRASDFLKNETSNANRTSDSLILAREAFQSGDYRLAVLEFEALTKREPANGRAHYWLGRARLELREYEMAAKNFEEAITLQPLMYDAYVQQAAAYQAMGEKPKAAAALARYAEERRKQSAER